MNDKYSTTEGKTSEKLSDEAMLSAQWKNIDWHKAEREVNRLQIRIVKATQQKDYNAVKRLQYLLTHSFYAKAPPLKRGADCGLFCGDLEAVQKMGRSADWINAERQRPAFFA